MNRAFEQAEQLREQVWVSFLVGPVHVNSLNRCVNRQLFNSMNRLNSRGSAQTQRFEFEVSSREQPEQASEQTLEQLDEQAEQVREQVGRGVGEGFRGGRWDS